MVLDFILELIKNPAIIVFAFTFLLGDEMVYLFSFLSGQGFFKLWIVVVFSILGNGGCDIFWFSVARSKYVNKVKKFLLKTEEEKEKETERKLINLNRKKMFSLLLLSKFFYGTRLLTIFYVAEKEKSFKKILLFNTLAVIIWVLVVSSLIYLVGKWTSVSFNIVNNIQKTIGIAALFIVIIYILHRILTPKIIRHLRIYFLKYK